MRSYLARLGSTYLRRTWTFFCSYRLSEGFKDSRVCIFHVSTHYYVNVFGHHETSDVTCVNCNTVDYSERSVLEVIVLCRSKVNWSRFV